MAVVFLIIYYFTRWGIWEAIINANLTGFDVLMADGFLFAVPLLIVTTFIFIVLKKRKKERIKPFSENELVEYVISQRSENEKHFYKEFLEKRLGVGKEGLFDGKYHIHLKQIIDLNNELKARNSSDVIHPFLLARIEEHFGSTDQQGGLPIIEQSAVHSPVDGEPFKSE